MINTYEGLNTSRMCNKRSAVDGICNVAKTHILREKWQQDVAADVWHIRKNDINDNYGCRMRSKVLEMRDVQFSQKCSTSSR